MKSEVWAAWPEIRPQVRRPAASTLGKLAYIFITNGGSGYTSAPTVKINNVEEKATASIRGGKVTAITIDNVGSGYTNHPSVTFIEGSDSSAD